MKKKAGSFCMAESRHLPVVRARLTRYLWNL